MRKQNRPHGRQDARLPINESAVAVERNQPNAFKHRVDILSYLHQYVYVRTTIDLPDSLHRAIKARASLTGVSVREHVQQLIERGLCAPADAGAGGRREPPPVIIPPRGVPIPALSRKELHRLEEEEDEMKNARSTRF